MERIAKSCGEIASARYVAYFAPELFHFLWSTSRYMDMIDMNCVDHTMIDNSPSNANELLIFI